MSFNIKGYAGPISGHNFDDEDGNPAGGHVNGVGFHVVWQDGPLGNGPDRKPASGAFVEDVCIALLERMRYYQEGKFACRENALVITKLEEAAHWMQHRREDRERRGVLGDHRV